jgi:hypothetical protein
MTEKVTAFNNAGVSCFEKGHHCVAWDLFKGALEVKVILEKCGCDTRLEPSQNENYLQLAGKNMYIRQAEYFLSHLEQYGVMGGEESCEGREHEEEQQQQSSPPPPPISFSTTTQFLPSTPCFVPYLFSRPLRISPSDLFPASAPFRENDSSIRLSNAQLSSYAIIIFNLAMVGHMSGTHHQNFADGKTCSTFALYNLASSLVSGQRASTIGLALMNNIGCWCFEHDNYSDSQRCMELMSHMLHRRRPRGDSQCVMSDDELKGLTSNIICILNPPHAASPAA